jgi:hypothetical protein
MVVFQTSQTKKSKNKQRPEPIRFGALRFLGLNLLRAANDVSRLNDALVKTMPFKNPA